MKGSRILAALLLAASFAACGHDPKAADKTNFQNAIAAFYDAHADHTRLCLTPPTFPVAMQDQRAYVYLPKVTDQAYNDDTRARLDSAIGLAIRKAEN
jgi:ABC-type uncharacterized transport system auxiliary subunit